MPYGKLAKLSGNPHVHLAKGSHFEHCCHETAAMKRADEGIAEMYKGKKRM
jgi:hypothetical protein